MSQGILQLDPLRKLIGEIHGDKLTVVIGCEFKAALLKPATHLPVVGDLTIVDNRHVSKSVAQNG